jgi:cobalt-zinc-cadmium efflux system protein
VGHSHPHHGHAHAAGSRRALRIALIFTVVFGLVEAVCGYVFGSLALISDAVHNVSDGFAIALALAAAWASGLPARGARTFGWRRAEVLAALVNGVTLIVLSIVIVWQALERLVGTQPAVTGWAVVIVGAIGLLANGIPVWVLLRDGDRENLNLRGALIHAGADLLGSAGAVVAGLLVLAGYPAADPVIAAAIGVLVAVTSFTLIRDSVRVLMEVAPEGVDVEQIGMGLARLPGVKQVHDLHVWTITSGMVAVAVHIVALDGADHDQLLHASQDLLAEHQITHATIQIDRDHDRLLQIHRPDCSEAPTARRA